MARSRKPKQKGGFIWMILSTLFALTFGILSYEIYMHFVPSKKTSQKPLHQPVNNQPVNKFQIHNDGTEVQQVQAPPKVTPITEYDVPEFGPPTKEEFFPKLTGQNSMERIYLTPIDFGYFRGRYIVLPINRSLTLTWQLDRDEPDFKRYQLLFSRFPDFRKNFGNDLFEDINTIKLRRFPLGYMYWKVRAQDSKTGQWTPFSDPVKLEIYTEVPGQNPIETKITENKYQSKRAHIAWAALPKVTSYEINYGFTRNFLDKKVITRQTRYDLVLGDNKKVYWKIRSLNEVGQPMSDFSKVHSATEENIQQYLALPGKSSTRDVAAIPINQRNRHMSPTEPLQPRTSSIIFSRSKKNKKPLKFTWAPVRGAEGYEVQIASTPEFHFTLYSDKTRKTRHIHRERLKLGQYFWRVRYRKNNTWSPWSKVSDFTVEQKTPY